SCGWNSVGFLGEYWMYACGSSAGADPSGTNPKQCPEPGCGCEDRICGADNCGASCGACPDGAVCIAGGTACCVPDCVGKTCGPDGCGGLCGICAPGLSCSVLGLCELVPQGCGEAPPGVAGCDGCPCQACVCEQDPDCCAQHWDADCAALCGQCESGYCPCYLQCDDKECGDDGCGGTCGECAPDEVCAPGGTCCVPDCDGKECGSDGCGGTCGECPDGLQCLEPKHLCITGCGGIEDLVPPECCEDGVVYYCVGSGPGKNVKHYSCYEMNGPGSFCGWDQWGMSIDCLDEKPVVPPPTCGFCSCKDKQCGPNGCGGTCGECYPGEVCIEGKCCLINCFDKQCGPDGCGGTCGECAPGEACVAGTCVCVPACEDKQCGPDGCGGECGTCKDGFACEDGLCVEEPCEPDCTGKDCGDDGCDSECGTCKHGYVCENHMCVEAPCKPDCAGKDCGGDGCDSECGTCKHGYVCENHMCVEAPCKPDCAGGNCGDDGCGGECGTCAADSVCSDGLCVPVSPDVTSDFSSPLDAKEPDIHDTGPDDVLMSTAESGDAAEGKISGGGCATGRSDPGAAVLVIMFVFLAAVRTGNRNPQSVSPNPH
ncbi:MAG: hypothetical protein GXP54_10025, partial [Deltaproteobacteria bacterium]|nr:hypothetical protein [Deltaproteobacteria bacterium]